MQTSSLILTGIGLCFLMGSWNLRERILVLITVPIIVWLVLRVRSSGLETPTSNAILAVGAGLLLYDTLVPRIVPHAEVIYSSYSHTLVTNTSWLLVGVGLFLVRRRVHAAVILTAVIFVAGVTGSLLILNTPEPPIDVWQLHLQGGEALVSGANPYADLDVESSFAADADSGVISGYSYTPPNLIGFGLTSSLTSDSRWFSLGCWILFIACLGIMSVHNPSRDALVWLVASQPAWPLVLEMGYTESLTLALIGGAVVAWRRNPLIAAGLLGVALASKQYLAVLIPLLLLTPLVTVKQRTAIVITGAVTASSGLIWGLADYWDAVVSFHGRVPPQASSINLYAISDAVGVPLLVPTALGAAVAAVLGIGMIWNRESITELILVSALTLGVAFVLAPQAFVNYWLLVACLICMAVSIQPAAERTTPGRHSPLPAVVGS